MAAGAPFSRRPPSHRRHDRISHISTEAGAGRRFQALAWLVILSLAAAIAAALLVGKPRALDVVDVSPAAGTTDVSLASQVAVTFSRPLDMSVPAGAITLSPPVDGLVSVAGRRAAFTPTDRLRADTAYTVTIGPGIRDRNGRTLADAVVSTFRTRPTAAIARIRDRGLFRIGLAGEQMEIAGGPIGDFAAAPSGAMAWIDVARHVVVVRRPGGAGADVPLPEGLTIGALEWAPRENALLFLGSRAGEPGTPFIVRLDTSPTILPLGNGAARADLPAPLVTERLKRSLIEVVYGRDSYTLTGSGAIVRDRTTWDFVVVDMDGRRLAAVGPFLAVGDASQRGDGILVVDVDPADPALVRSVALYTRDGRLRPLSSPGVDTHAPRFSHSGAHVVVAAAPAAEPPRRRRFGLTVIEVATGRRRILTRPPEGTTDAEPQWSPDDTWLLFRRMPLDEAGPSEVWIVAAAGGEPRRLAPDVDAARWMP